MKPKKLKLDRNFKPLLLEEGEELFANGIFEFNVTKLLAFIEANPEMFPLEHLEVGPLTSFEPGGLNEETIRKADVSAPIVLAEISPGRFNVIDGNHRLERARRDGLAKIAARRVSAARHFPFLTSTRAYEAYVKYWNSKLHGE